MILVALDPGVWAMGWAVFRDRVLVAAGCSKVPRNKTRGPASIAAEHANTISASIYEARGLGRGWGLDVGHHGVAGLVDIVCEHMCTRGPEAPQRPDDLIMVEAVGCLTAARLGHVSRLYPASEWKGSIPKDVHHPRIRAALGPVDEIVIATFAAAQAGKTNVKEVWDAIGIGLFSLGRIDSKGEKR